MEKRSNMFNVLYSINCNEEHVSRLILSHYRIKAFNNQYKGIVELYKFILINFVKYIKKKTLY